MHQVSLPGIYVKYENYILNVSIVHRRSIMGYSGEKNIPFLKISLAAPMIVPGARKLLEAGFLFKNNLLTMLTYESNIQFVLRYMIDQDIVGASWIKCPAATYSVVPFDEQTSRCQIEVTIAYV